MFDHLPYRIAIPASPEIIHFKMLDAMDEHLNWCASEVNHAWEWDFAFEPEGFCAVFYFESEEDALLFKLTWR